MMKIIFLVLIILISQSTFAQFQICNSDTNHDLHDIYFVDQSVGIAVGDSGTIVRSIDGGLNWSLVMNNDTVEFYKVKFFDSLNGMAIGTDMYRTSDAGLTWSKIPHSNTMFLDIEILNPTTCLISGRPTALIKSIDTGGSFSNIVFQENHNMHLLSFIDEDIGYACQIWDGGSSPTLKTINGGINWDTLEHKNHNTVMEAMSFISESEGFKGGWYNPNLQKTTDSANSWDFINYADTQEGGHIRDFHIEQNMPNAYYACGLYGQIFKSTDGGDNWTTLHSGLSDKTTLNGIYFISDSSGWAVGTNGTIIKTTNGGLTVGISELKEAINLAIFPNPTNNWLQIDNPKNYKIGIVGMYNMHGQKIEVTSHGNKIDMTDFSSGFYILVIEANKKNYSEIIVKE